MIDLNFPHPVTSEDGFFNRHKEWTAIKQAFQAAGRTPIIILGERRAGKTSLQIVATKRLETSTLLPLRLPFGSSMHSTNDFAQELLQSLCMRLGRDIRTTDLCAADTSFRFKSLGQYTQTLRSVIGQSSKEFFVCVDEFDATLRNCEQQGDTGLLDLVTHLVHEGQGGNLPIRFFFSMTGMPETLKRAFDSPFITESILVELCPLSYADTAEMVQGLLTPAADIRSEALQYLFDLSGGHPYVIKLLLTNLLAPRDFTAEGLIIDRAEIESAAIRAIDDPRSHHALANLYDVHFGDAEKGLMILLAMRQAQGQDSVSRRELRIIEPKGVPYVTAAEALVRRGYLVKFPDTKNPEEDQYRWRIAFLGRWLHQWERYEAEVEKRLQGRDILRRLQRLQNPWHKVSPTAVTPQVLRELGLRP